MSFNVEQVRKHFPQLNEVKVNNKKLVYLDNGATTLKPQIVIDRVRQHYANEASNIHRGVHTLSMQGTTAYENVRLQVQKFINAKSEKEVIFTSGTTASINLVAQSWGTQFVSSGDEIVVSAMEHHSNIVPWQMLCERVGAVLKVLPMNISGELIEEEFEKLITKKTKLVCVNSISNTLGTINPIQKLISLAHAVGAKILIDGAQSVLHELTDVQKLDCDFFVFSGHKMLGPTGNGVLYAKEELLNAMPPVNGGGDMIKRVTFAKTTYNDLPFKFEAGTPHIAGVLGLGAAIQFIESLGGVEVYHNYEDDLLKYAQSSLQNISGIRFIGTAKQKSSIVSFVMEGTHSTDVGTILDQEGVAVRTGHHCTHPVMDFYGVSGTVRASFAFYNTKEEIDVLKMAVEKAARMLRD